MLLLLLISKTCLFPNLTTGVVVGGGGIDDNVVVVVDLKELSRPHHRLQHQQHRSLFYILPCLLLAVLVNIPKFFETETVAMKGRYFKTFSNDDVTVRGCG